MYITPAVNDHYAFVEELIAMFVLIDWGDHHPCMRQAEMQSGTDFFATKLRPQVLVSIFRPTYLVFGAVSY